MAMSEHGPGASPARDPTLDRLYRDAGGEEPPAYLDAAILAAAHREAGARPRARPPILRRWQVPASIAAVVVLSVSLVTLVREEGGEPLVQPPPPILPAAPPAPSAAQPPPTGAESSRPRVAVSAPDRREEPQREEGARAPAVIGSVGREAASDTDPALAQQGAGVAAQPEGVSGSRPQPFRDSAAPVDRRSAAPQAAPAEDAEPRKPTAERSAPASMSTGPAAPARSVAAQARKESVADEARKPVWQGYESELPQKWLDRIVELRRLERIADADAMLAEFRRRFPGHPVPAAPQ